MALGALLLATANAAAETAPTVSFQASATQVASGRPVTLTGQASAAPPGSAIGLYQSPYPFTASVSVAGTQTAPDGSFSFTVTPDRNMRYAAVVAGSPPSEPVEVDVTGLTFINARALPLGRAQVTVVAYHPRDLLWDGARVSWSFTGPGFSAIRSSTALRLSPYVAVLRTTVTLPAGRFSWGACLRAPGARALLDPGRPAGCRGRGYRGAGSLPAGFPDAGAVRGAGAYLGRRTGRTAFAVVDSEGRLSGVNVHSTFNTASVVKAMLLTAYLRRLDALGQRYVDSYSNSFLYPMIHVSDNNAATRCWSIVGNGGLWSVASAAGMTEFSVTGRWGSASLSPADQARFFFQMDSLIPKQFIGYARFLLSTIDPSQSWAIPVAARPLGYQVFFKDGSEPTGLGQLVHQVARIEGHGRTFALAVMTDGDPTMQYGIDTIQGVAAALLH
jgi:hypothetical protein